MPSENKVTLSGHLHKTPEMKAIPTTGGSLDLCEANLVYTTLRGDQEKEMYVDVEGFGEMAFELADVPAQIDLRVTGELIRAAWKSKKTGDWTSKHVIRLKKIEMLGEAKETESPIQF